MVVRVVRLGSARAPGEGTRIGTVRRPPRGVPKALYAAQDWYDVWLPNLAPSAETVKMGLAARSPGDWAAFARRYRAEMNQPERSRVLDVLAALSHHADFSVGCYCEDEARCHRSVLRTLLREKGARLLSSESSASSESSGASGSSKSSNSSALSTSSKSSASSKSSTSSKSSASSKSSKSSRSIGVPGPEIGTASAGD